MVISSQWRKTHRHPAIETLFKFLPPGYCRANSSFTFFTRPSLPKALFSNDDDTEDYWGPNYDDWKCHKLLLCKQLEAFFRRICQLESSHPHTFSPFKSVDFPRENWSYLKMTIKSFSLHRCSWSFTQDSLCWHFSNTQVLNFQFSVQNGYFWQCAILPQY